MNHFDVGGVKSLGRKGTSTYKSELVFVFKKHF
jgi:hypothetical protein